MRIYNIGRWLRLGFFVSVFCFSLWGTAILRLNIAQSDEHITKQTIQKIPQRESSNLDQLTSLLSGDGISVDNATLLPSRVNQSRTVLARWKTTDTFSSEKPFTTEMAQEGTLSLLKIKSNQGSLARQRSLEFSTTQILIVMLNQNNQVLWWDLMPDPRLFRAETADTKGYISGEMLYRTNVEMLVSYPLDNAITELRFYRPDWDGQSYSLRSIGNLFVASITK